MKTKDAKEKPAPARCACGSEAVIVVFRGKKMISCPNPERCVGNFRTQWKSSTVAAISEWNGVIDSYKYTR